MEQQAGHGVIRSGIEFDFATDVAQVSKKRKTMKRLCTALFVIAVLVIGLGFYRNWFTVTKAESAGGGSKVSYNLTVDEAKVKEDAQALKNKAAGLSRKTT